MGQEKLDQECDVLFFPDKSNEQKVIDFINLAKKELKICVFTFTNTAIATAILKKVENEKIKVRIITDDVQNEGKFSIVDVLQYASDDLIKFRTDLNKDAHMHHKYVVIDDKMIATGSFNWTSAAVLKNNENLLLIKNQKLAKIYSKNFEELWEQFKSTEKSLSKLSSDVKQRGTSLKNKIEKEAQKGEKQASSKGRKKAQPQEQEKKQVAGDMIIENEEEDEDQVKRSRKPNNQQQQKPIEQEDNNNPPPSNQTQNGDTTPVKRGRKPRQLSREEEEELQQKKENAKKKKKIKKLVKMSKVTEVKRVVLQSKMAQSRFQKFKNILYNAASFTLGVLSFGSYLYLSQRKF
ncbi:phospholipase D1 (macronuclear) [Tetrahymena thermophila SB210]|uniref:Mitochondrial cardiolipin hydrolase n=1 Tax=Tetrahymena thermophila (strain SB210) TaxID=312017 RepID=I7MDI9_TETTS|nr:phospholipase D1 [Tetrahymena thermophila SB210]EAR87695.1 phospholipase D1 [Tetrahymena thermophila SB210]|eukprot:XP_001007940.1 phospholipase D1 [Tetrahymena thermophila SB210]